MTDRPSPAEVVAEKFYRFIPTDPGVIGDIAIAALHDSDFLLVHESDRARLIEAVNRLAQFHFNEDETLASVAVAAVIDALRNNG